MATSVETEAVLSGGTRNGRIEFDYVDNAPVVVVQANIGRPKQRCIRASFPWPTKALPARQTF